MRLPLRAVLAVVRRPRLWPTALLAAARLSAPGWWRRWPPVPSPPDAYGRFRAVTARGGTDPAVDPADLVAWLEWCRTNRGHLH